jgi:O-antigen ligase
MTNWTTPFAISQYGPRIVLTCVAILLGAFVARHGATPAFAAGMVALIVYASFAALSILEPLFFVAAFLMTLEILPPLYFARSGDQPLYLSCFLLPVGFLIIISRFRDMHFTWDPLAKGLACFLACTACSLPFAAWLSGSQAGWSSLARWLLLSQTALVYFLTRGGARRQESRMERGLYPLLYLAAGLSAGYGIVDFIWPVPLPHPALDQFIWLDATALRRAQGVFYESLSFANFCGFFVVLGSAAILSKRESYLRLPRWLLIVFTVILSLAVLVAFSRSTWAAIAVALAVFSFQSKLINARRAGVLLLALGVPLVLLWTFSPNLWRYFLEVRVGHLAELLSDPDFATSGRYGTWLHIFDIIRENPQYLVFGIGYKTLSFTRLFHGAIIVDNGFLSLLVETGVVGLAGFLIFSGVILKTFFRLTQQNTGPVAFWAALMFAIWCGELVQLMAVDAYTFWRSMAILVALMALTMNRAERGQRCFQ